VKSSLELGKMDACNEIFIFAALNTEDMCAISTPTSNRQADETEFFRNILDA
jgi:hypothetical protein